MLVLLVSILPASIASDGVPESGMLTVTVKDSVTGDPIEGVELFVHPAIGPRFDFEMWDIDIIWEDYMQFTDANGTAVFQLPPGMYHMRAHKDWYFGKGMDIDMAEGTNITLDMQLEAMPEPPSKISGYVTGTNTGEGIEGAFVHLMPITPPRSWLFGGWYEEAPEFIYPLHTETDSTGYYELGVEPSMYMVNVNMEGYYHAEEQVDIGDDEVVELNFTLEAWPEPTSSISGHVYDFETGEVIENVTIFAFPLPFYEDMNIFGFGGLGGIGMKSEPEQPLMRTFEATTDENGSYHMMVSKGRYELLVETEGYTPTFNNIQVPDSVDMTIDLSLRPIPVPEYDAFLSGYVLDEEGNPIPDAEISLMPSFGLFKQRAGYDWEGVPEPVDMYMEDEGFSFGILDGIFDIFGLESIMSEAIGMDIGYGYAEEFVMGDMPIFDEVMATQPLGLFNAMTFTDENGSYAMDAFSGTYFVTVWAEGYRTFYREIIIDEGDNVKNLTLKPAPEGESWICGTVFDGQTGRPMPGVLLNVFLEGQGGSPMPGQDGEAGFWWDEIQFDQFFKSIETDENGKFRLPVPSGNVNVEADARGYQHYQSSFSMDPDEQQNVRIRMRPQKGDEADPDNFGGEVPRIQKLEQKKNAPQPKEVTNIQMRAGQIFNINIDDLFIDMDNDMLNIFFDSPRHLKVLYDPTGKEIVVEAPEDWEGEEEITVYASDGDTTSETTIPVQVMLSEPTPRPLGAFAMFYAVGILAALGVLFLVSKYQTKEDE